MRDSHDRGSATPLAVAIIAVASLALVALSHTSARMVDSQRATIAAEALALAVAQHLDTSNVIADHDISDHSVIAVGDTITVRITRNGVAARATATVHRRTLERGQ